MSRLERELHPAVLRWELPMVCLLAWLGLCIDTNRRG